MTRPAPLSPTEIVLIRHLAQGRSSGWIGLHYGFTEARVHTMIATLVRRTRARNRAHLVAMAFGLGVLAYDERGQLVARRPGVAA